MISSFIPGRIRVRNAFLKNTETAKKTIKLCSGLPGFLSAEHNPAAGSILLIYDPAALPHIFTASAFAAYVKKNIPGISRFFAKPSQSGGKAFNRAMAASLAVCLLSPYAGMIKLHIYSGIFFYGPLNKTYV